MATLFAGPTAADLVAEQKKRELAKLQQEKAASGAEPLPSGFQVPMSLPDQQLDPNEEAAKNRAYLQEDGSKESLPTTDDFTGNYLDLNPNNQPEDMAGMINQFLSASQSLSSTPAVEEIIKRREARTSAEDRAILDAINNMEKRRSGIDLTPLAALIDDPNKAKILSMFGDQPKQEDIDELKIKLGMRQDARQQANDALRIQAAQNDAKLRADLAEKLIKNFEDTKLTRKDLEERIDKKTTEFNSSIKQIQSKAAAASQISELLRSTSEVDEKGNIKFNPKTLATLQTIAARNLAEDVGALSDADVERQGGSPELLERAQRVVLKWTKGQIFSNQDIIDLDILANAVAAKKLEEIDSMAKTFSAQKSGFLRTSPQEMYSNVLRVPELKASYKIRKGEDIRSEWNKAFKGKSVTANLPKEVSAAYDALEEEARRLEEQLSVTGE